MNCHRSAQLIRNGESLTRSTMLYSPSTSPPHDNLTPTDMSRHRPQQLLMNVPLTTSTTFNAPSNTALKTTSNTTSKLTQAIHLMITWLPATPASSTVWFKLSCRLIEGYAVNKSNDFPPLSPLSLLFSSLTSWANAYILRIKSDLWNLLTTCLPQGSFRDTLTTFGSSPLG